LKIGSRHGRNRLRRGLGVWLLMAVQLHVLIVAELHRHADSFTVETNLTPIAQGASQRTIALKARNPICEICWIARHVGGQYSVAEQPLSDLPVVEGLVIPPALNDSAAFRSFHFGRAPPQG
jgi:hypothetical protein